MNNYNYRCERRMRQKLKSQTLKAGVLDCNSPLTRDEYQYEYMNTNSTLISYN